ncbi:MAG: hypothetical protein EBU01_01845 [Crocinitomicaceae bacterium]|nr:hypothetical protein [Crocinitomicaceae bacterium]
MPRIKGIGIEHGATMIDLASDEELRSDAPNQLVLVIDHIGLCETQLAHRCADVPSASSRHD